MVGKKSHNVRANTQRRVSELVSTSTGELAAVIERNVQAIDARVRDHAPLGLSHALARRLQIRTHAKDMAELEKDLRPEVLLKELESRAEEVNMPQPHS